MNRIALQRRAPAFALGMMLAACAPRGTVPAAPGPVPEAPPQTYAGYPGFDTNIYPGDETMRTWRGTSPYQWVGYYLPAPCHRDVSWAGKRDALVTMGWGTAVIYLGQQDWSAMPNRAPAPDTAARVDSATVQPQPPASVAAPACSSANLSAARGATDAADAAARTAAEGFPPGSVIYLDVERVIAVSPALADYVRGWVDGVLGDGRFTPGIYAHRLDADAVLAAARTAYTARGRSGDPPLWVTSSTGFSLQLPPGASGIANAGIWQGVLDVQETWGGRTIQIDVNVADSRSPSAPRGTP